MTNISLNKELIKSLLDTAISGCLLVNNAGEVVSANQNALTMLGYSDESGLYGKEIHDKIHQCADVYNEDDCFICKSFKDGKRYSNMLTTFKKNNEELFKVTVNVAPVIIENEVAGAVIYFKDITEELKDNLLKERLKMFVEQVEVGFIITDTKGYIEYVNDGYSKICGYSPSELVGKNMNILKSGEHDKDFYKKLWGTITRGKRYDEVLINRKKNGEKYYEKASILPVKEKNGRIINYMAIKQDITKEYLLEEKTIETQKLESIGKLAGGIAHDFNNILTSMVAYLEMADEIADEGTDLKRYIAQIQKAEERAERLVNQILGFSRKQMIAPKVQDMSLLLEEDQKMLKRMIPENINIQFDIKKDENKKVKIDVAQFHQIMLNLVINSKDALEEIGKREKEIKISLEYKKNSEIDSAVDFSKKYYAILKVYDNGTGIKKENFKKVFDPFFTTKKIGQGSGLGLSSVYGIVKQNGGEINLNSKEGEFTEITIYWPCVKEEKLIEKVFHIDSSNGEKVDRILIVDDEEMIRDIMRTTFSRAGYDVLEAENGKEALEKIKTEDISIVVTDITMPEMNGDVMVQEAIKVKKDLKFIFITGYDLKESDIAKGIASKIIQKPYRPAQLVEAVKEISVKE